MKVNKVGSRKEIENVIGNNMRRLIARNNMTISELADELGTSRCLISNYIHGVKSPKASSLFLIAKAVNADVGEFFEGIE